MYSDAFVTRSIESHVNLALKYGKRHGRSWCASRVLATSVKFWFLPINLFNPQPPSDDLRSVLDT